MEKAKKEVEEAVKNFKASDEYSDRMMVEYANGFELLQKYLIKHHPDLNFALLDIEEIEKEMVATEAALVSAVAIVRLNFINHLVGFIPYQICLYLAISNPVFRWESCKGSE